MLDLVSVPVSSFTLFSFHPRFHLPKKWLVDAQVYGTPVYLRFTREAKGLKLTVTALTMGELKYYAVTTLVFSEYYLSPAAGSCASGRTGEGIAGRVIFEIVLGEQVRANTVVFLDQAEISSNPLALEYVHISSGTIGFVTADLLRD